MLTIKNLRVQYGAFAALQDVTLSIAEGQVVSIVGANGAGKTTLINTLVGATRQHAGRIMLGAGAIMGFRAAWSMLAGAIVNFAVLAPHMYAIGVIDPPVLTPSFTIGSDFAVT